MPPSDWKRSHLGFFLSFAIFFVVFITVTLPDIRFYDSTECQVVAVVPQYCCSHFCDNSCSPEPDNIQTCSELEELFKQSDPMTVGVLSFPILTLANYKSDKKQCNSTAPLTTCPPRSPLSLNCKNAVDAKKCRYRKEMRMIKCAMSCESCINVVMNVTGKTSAGIQLTGKPTVGVNTTTEAAAVMEKNKVGTKHSCFYDRDKPEELFFEMPLNPMSGFFELLMSFIVWLRCTIDVTHFWLNFGFGKSITIPWGISYNLWVGLIIPLGVCSPVRVFVGVSIWGFLFKILGVTLFAVGNFPLIVWLFAKTPVSRVSGWIYFAFFVVPVFIVWPVVSVFSVSGNLWDAVYVMALFTMAVFLIGALFTSVWFGWKEGFLEFANYIKQKRSHLRLLDSRTS